MSTLYILIYHSTNHLYTLSLSKHSSSLIHSLLCMTYPYVHIPQPGAAIPHSFARTYQLCDTALLGCNAASFSNQPNKI